MTTKVKIGVRWVSEGEPCFVIAEIGINHNGSLDIARKLISVALLAGCDAIKFKKRTVDVVFSPEELDRPRETPFGTTTGDLKRRLGFDYGQYKAIDDYCRQHNMLWLSYC